MCHEFLYWHTHTKVTENLNVFLGIYIMASDEKHKQGDIIRLSKLLHQII